MGVSPTSSCFRALYGVMTRQDRVARVRSLAARVARDSGLDVFDVEFRRESIGWVLRVVIDRTPDGRAGGAERSGAGDSVTVDDCQRVSRDVSALLDTELAFDQPYTLEVSSPGLDRPLRHIEDCRRFRGRLARFVTSEAIDGQRFLSGRIADVEEPGSAAGRDGAASVMLETAGRVHRIPWALVRRARLEVEL